MNLETEAVEERLKQILLDVVRDEVDPSQIRSEVALINEGLSLDSVALLEFVVRIENEFSIILDDGVLTREHFESLGSLAGAVQREIARQAKS
ncbi:MAG: hypothetical protein HY820_27160 [Acidobacteria bacterium]|nr:hypothetical protein [Acidobacteriota bacterium]